MAQLEKLHSNNFSEYIQALADLRQLIAGNSLSFDDGKSFLMTLRPFFWYIHQPGFQDLYNVSSHALDLISLYKSELQEKVFFRNSGLVPFLKGYCMDMSLDRTGWAFLSSSPELAASIDAEDFTSCLKELNKPSEHIKVFEDLSTSLQNIERAKHDAYWMLRKIGNKFIAELDIIHTLYEGDQSMILHSLDEFIEDEGVILFYKNFIEETKFLRLKEEADLYLKTVAGK